MNILVGSLQCESNTFSDKRAILSDFNMLYDEACLKKLYATEVFRNEGFQVTPLLYAAALPSGNVDRSSFDSLVSAFLDRINEVSSYDGVYIYLHGSMYVEKLGSGEEHFMRAIRKAIGQDVPVSVALDYHANLPSAFFTLVDAVQGFRTAPHTDHENTERRAALSLIDCIRYGKRPNLAWIHLPFLCGDAATTDREPFVSINKILENYDKKDEVVSAAFFNGQPWFDTPYTGGCAVVSTVDGSAFDKAVTIAKTFWDGRLELNIKNSIAVEAVVQESLLQRNELTVVSDSGDNTTAGADGTGTLLLRLYLTARAENVLVCGITDSQTVMLAKDIESGGNVRVLLNVGSDKGQAKEINVDALKVSMGEVYGWSGESAGLGILFRSEGVDFVVTERRAAFISPDHFAKMNICINDYRVVVIKQGYLFPALQTLNANHLFALTPGQSSNDFGALDYKHFVGEHISSTHRFSWDDVLKNARKEARHVHNS